MSEMNSLETMPDVASTENGPQATQNVASDLRDGWEIVQVKSRVDSLNQAAMMDEVRALRSKGALKIALNMSANRFLSLLAIQFIVDAAREVNHEGGLLALISCPQKTKRHFEIYGSLNHIHVVRSESELAKLRPRDI